LFSSLLLKHVIFFRCQRSSLRNSKMWLQQPNEVFYLKLKWKPKEKILEMFKIEGK
jgi:hypothetical protein